MRFGLKAYAWVCFGLAAIIWALREVQTLHYQAAELVLSLMTLISGPVSYLVIWNYSRYGPMIPTAIGDLAIGALVFLVSSAIILPLLILPFVKRQSLLARAGFCLGAAIWMFLGWVSFGFFLLSSL